jgi:hypothetical protein
MERLREPRWSSNATESRRPLAPFSPIRFELAAASRTRYEKARHARCRAIESVARALHNGADMPAAMRCGAAQRDACVLVAARHLGSEPAWTGPP